MQISIINTVPHATIPEKFFVDKCLELLYHGTIESYRLQLHNPKTALKELVNIARSRNNGEISNDEHLKLMTAEIDSIFRKETYLDSSNLSDGYRNTVLKNKTVKDVFYMANLILKNNENYTISLFTQISGQIASLNADAYIIADKLKPLSELTAYFLIELREKGYSKRYLHKFITEIFFKSEATSFFNRMEILKGLINRTESNFKVIIGFKLAAGMAAQVVILDPNLQKLNSQEISRITRSTNLRIRDYFTARQPLTFYSLTVASLDYYQASFIVRRELQSTLDVLFMGYTNDHVNVDPLCVVMGPQDPSKASIQSLDYDLEGHFKGDQALYNIFAANISLMKTKEVSSDAINKIESALRYLRSGSGVSEIENKLLNYWIAIEYFFSGTDANTNKVERARNYFKKIHAITYFKRLLVDFHNSIKLYHLEHLIPTFAEDMEYLKDINTFTIVASNINTPAIAYRAQELVIRLSNRESIIKNLKNHSDKLEWNLMRIYRRRNSIVHSAKSEGDILDLTSHLKYYLVYIINSAIDFINHNPIDMNMDGKISLDDFFLIRHVEFENLMYDPHLDINRLMNYKNPLEYLT